MSAIACEVFVNTESSLAVDTEPLFGSAHAAVRFALTFEGRPERPAMNRQYVSPISDGIRPPGKGLSGLDGAAQAGIIRSKMEKLGIVADAALIARAAPRTVRCECRNWCCAGTKRNATWGMAIDTLTDHTRIILKGKQVSFEIRKAMVMRAFGERVVLQDLAESTGINRDTLGTHYARVLHWIAGRRAAPGHDAVEGIEPQAWANIETALRDSGIVC